MNGAGAAIATSIRIVRSCFSILFGLLGAFVFVSVASHLDLYDWTLTLARLIFAMIFAAAGWLLWPRAASPPLRRALWVYFFSISIAVALLLAAPYVFLYMACAYDVRSCP